MSTEGRLSPTEWQVLAHAGAGHTNTETARALGSSVLTVKKHRANIRRKAGGVGAGRDWLERLARRLRDRLPVVA